MDGTFTNSYEDRIRATAYSQLEFPGTYFLAFRDLPEILRRSVIGRRALDLGCGAGRSTRFLRDQGFDVIGVDVAADMLARARAIDPQGDYRLVGDGDLGGFPDRAFDVALSAFTFDNVPTRERKVKLLRELGRLLCDRGRAVLVDSTPEIYLYEWASFSTRDFPENRAARSGDVVRTVITDIADRRPVEDVLCTDEEYRGVFASAGLALLETHKPLARAEEPYRWVNETRIAPWVIYVLGRAG
jgi:SAM-dependent methyltransferase